MNTTHYTFTNQLTKFRKTKFTDLRVNSTVKYPFWIKHQGYKQTALTQDFGNEEGHLGTILSAYFCLN